MGTNREGKTTHDANGMAYGTAKASSVSFGAHVDKENRSMVGNMTADITVPQVEW